MQFRMFNEYVCGRFHFYQRYFVFEERLAMSTIRVFTDLRPQCFENVWFVNNAVSFVPLFRSKISKRTIFVERDTRFLLYLFT